MDIINIYKKFYENFLVDESETGHKCEFEEKTYFEGQRIYPKNSCTVCICGKGFNGK